MDQLEQYFLNNVDYLWIDGSSSVIDKAFYHQKNYIHPYMKLTTLQAAEIECGSEGSNFIRKNEKAKQLQE